MALKQAIKIGFVGSASIRALPTEEILKRNLPLVFFCEFQEPLTCISAIGGEITIPKGMLSDGASVPKVVWNILSPTDPHIFYPAFVHDLIYLLKGKLPGVTLTRDQGDNIIREQMKAVGAPAWKYDTVYRMLHEFGAAAWNKKRPLQQKKAARPTTK